MRRGAEALRTPADLTRIGLGVGHELGQRLYRHVLVNDHDLGGVDELADRHKRLDRIVADVAVHGRAGGQRAARRDQEGIAVGIRGRDELCADAAARAAAAVLHHDVLAEDCPEPVRDDACHAVGRPAGRERHDHPDRPIGIGLGVRRLDAVQRPSGAQRCCKQGSHHLGLLRVSPATQFVIVSRDSSDDSRTGVNIYVF